MARPSRLHRDQVLDAAMALFWSRGYGAVSMDDLVRATGAARYGLYGLFGDKRGLYLAALERYQEVVINRLFGGVEAPDAGPDQINGYFQGLLAMAASPQGRWGCLMAGAAQEMADAEPAVAVMVDRYRGRLRAAFARALGGGRESRADLLVSLAFGLPVMARAGAGAESLAAAVAAVAL